MIKICREHIGEVVYVESGADVCPACWEIQRLKERIDSIQTKPEANITNLPGDK